MRSVLGRLKIFRAAVGALSRSLIIEAIIQSLGSCAATERWQLVPGMPVSGASRLSSDARLILTHNSLTTGYLWQLETFLHGGYPRLTSASERMNSIPCASRFYTPENGNGNPIVYVSKPGISSGALGYTYAG